MSWMAAWLLSLPCHRDEGMPWLGGWLLPLSPLTSLTAPRRAHALITRGSTPAHIRAIPIRLRISS